VRPDQAIERRREFSSRLGVQAILRGGVGDSAFRGRDRLFD
jgi:hypothetical protein